MPVGDFCLSGKVVVVTGAGSGINLAFARSAEQSGAKIVVADLKLTREAEEFITNAAGKSTAVFVSCDVTKRTDLENLVEEAQRSFGQVPDVWIAGAGVFEPVRILSSPDLDAWSNFWDDTEGDGYKQVDINVNHPMKLSRIAIRALLGKGKPGVVLVVSSLAGYQGAFSSPLYCATKHACVGFVRSMADLDRLESIKVVLVAPGFVRTPLWTDHPEKMKQFGYSLENSVTAETVANNMNDLVTKAQYAGGTCLEVSAGGSRLLGIWNIPEPSGQGTGIDADVLQENYKPILTKLQSERATFHEGQSNGS
ncbi:hypothetical protein LTR10_018678 [Elasticomyces elasticus]|uniref:NAD(P)-binding protein n=1 Tax=Exophiala sideris TaxID=1016849 RepID=A0ABR0JS43_9EURO|nr:hypothetical protein LTR10_018678 [Elasticomyces elasticus]KAK5040425.1 hypothetical protein LTS07_000923 [Exophiala sideris]KAK5043149.1 hypothetical protein LTR13_000920 [Exophiala sideris]KAK5068803.1 hypothetical protein LTR69_000924 [Exophiala sideris]KAK5186400.1 hypothetical protein LTR44_001456 [Eurotiomycetes sp. CCFEE 6388]